MMNLPHIESGIDGEGQLFVSVEDTELFDYVEDHLIENCDIEYECFENSEINGVSVYTMFFPSNINKEELDYALSKLSALEVQRIFRINNPRGGK